MVSLHWASVNSDLVVGLTFDYGQKALQREIGAGIAICRHYDVKHRILRLPLYDEIKVSALIDPQRPLPRLSEEDLENHATVVESAQAVWVPNRNGVFINHAAVVAEDLMANWIVAGFNKEEAQTFPDNSLEFIKAINQSLKYSTQNKVELVAPMAEKTKKEIVQWAIENKVDLSPVWSCYLGEDRMCGACESCLRLRRALHDAEALEWTKRLF